MKSIQLRMKKTGKYLQSVRLTFSMVCSLCNVPINRAPLVCFLFWKLFRELIKNETNILVSIVGSIPCPSSITNFILELGVLYDFVTAELISESKNILIEMDGATKIKRSVVGLNIMFIPPQRSTLDGKKAEKVIQKETTGVLTRRSMIFTCENEDQNIIKDSFLSSHDLTFKGLDKFRGKEIPKLTNRILGISETFRNRGSDLRNEFLSSINEILEIQHILGIPQDQHLDIEKIDGILLDNCSSNFGTKTGFVTILERQFQFEEGSFLSIHCLDHLGNLIFKKFSRLADQVIKEPESKKSVTPTTNLNLDLGINILENISKKKRKTTREKEKRKKKSKKKSNSAIPYQDSIVFRLATSISGIIRNNFQFQAYAFEKLGEYFGRGSKVTTVRFGSAAVCLYTIGSNFQTFVHYCETTKHRGFLNKVGLLRSSLTFVLFVSVGIIWITWFAPWMRDSNKIQTPKKLIKLIKSQLILSKNLKEDPEHFLDHLVRRLNPTEQKERIMKAQLLILECQAALNHFREPEPEVQIISFLKKDFGLIFGIFGEALDYQIIKHTKKNNQRIRKSKSKSIG